MHPSAPLPSKADEIATLRRLLLDLHPCGYLWQLLSSIQPQIEQAIADDFVVIREDVASLERRAQAAKAEAVDLERRVAELKAEQASLLRTRAALNRQLDTLADDADAAARRLRLIARGLD